MVHDIKNYLESMKEHIEICTSHLDDYVERMDSETLDNKDYFAIERLLQLIIESGIGLAKQVVKAKDKLVRTSADENFKVLNELGLITSEQLELWQSMIGLRNVLVYEYLDIDQKVLNAVLEQRLYRNTKEFCDQMIKLLSENFKRPIRYVQ